LEGSLVAIKVELAKCGNDTANELSSHV